MATDLTSSSLASSVVDSPGLCWVTMDIVPKSEAMRQDAERQLVELDGFIATVHARTRPRLRRLVSIVGWPFRLGILSALAPFVDR